MFDLCCLPRRRRAPAAVDATILTTTISSKADWAKNPSGIADRATSQNAGSAKWEFHATSSWTTSLESAVRSLSQKDQELLAELSDKNSIELSLEYLRSKYLDRATSVATQNLSAFLRKINRFTLALTSLSQAGPSPAMLVWGSVQLLMTVSTDSRACSGMHLSG